MKKILILISVLLVSFAIIGCESLGYVLAGISDGMSSAGYGSSSSSSSSYSGSYSSSSSSSSSSSNSYSHSIIMKIGKYKASSGGGYIRLTATQYGLYDFDDNLVESGNYTVKNNTITFDTRYAPGTVYNSESFSFAYERFYWVEY